MSIGEWFLRWQLRRRGLLGIYEIAQEARKFSGVVPDEYRFYGPVLDSDADLDAVVKRAYRWWVARQA